MQDIYVLPEIQFVGGENQKFYIYLWTPPPNSEPFNANGCVVNFSIINYSNKIGVPVLSKLCEIENNTDGIPCIAVVELLADETVMLYGKYIYQITIIDPDSKTEIPNQGLMYIAKNINQGFIQSHIH